MAKRSPARAIDSDWRLYIYLTTGPPALALIGLGLPGGLRNRVLARRSGSFTTGGMTGFMGDSSWLLPPRTCIGRSQGIRAFQQDCYVLLNSVQSCIEAVQATLNSPYLHGQPSEHSQDQSHYDRLRLAVHVVSMAYRVPCVCLFRSSWNKPSKIAVCGLILARIPEILRAHRRAGARYAGPPAEYNSHVSGAG